MESVSLGEAWEPAFLASSQPKPASRAETCVVSQGPVLRRELNLVSWSTVTLLKLLIIFNLNLCFEGKAGWSSVACVRMEQMRAVQYEYACPVSCYDTIIGYCNGKWPMSMNSGGSSAGLKASRGECVMSRLRKVRSTDRRGTRVCCEPIRRNDVLRYMNNQGTISYPFMLLLFIKLAT